jgi:hypothetical protein
VNDKPYKTFYGHGARVWDFILTHNYIISVSEVGEINEGKEIN